MWLKPGWSFLYYPRAELRGNSVEVSQLNKTKNINIFQYAEDR